MSSLEARLRDHFARLAELEQAPPNVSISAAVRRGRRLRRWRRARIAGSPVLAVSAVAAVVLAGLLPAGKVDSARPRREAASPADLPAAAPTQFDPLVPYASFGWLPPGERQAGGGNQPVEDVLNVDAGRTFTWQLSTYADGACQVEGDAELQCSLADSATEGYPLAGRARSVSGRAAFWTGTRLHQSVAWQYAPNGWAVLSNARVTSQSSQMLLRIAAGVVFGAWQPPIEFAAQLTGVPPTWRISTDTFRQVSGMKLAYQYSFAAAGSNPRDLPMITLSAGSGTCYFYPAGQSVRDVINDDHVVVNTIPAARGNPTVYQVCVPDANGLFVFISVIGGNPVIDPVTLFRHMKLLGTSPASWVTQPTG